MLLEHPVRACMLAPERTARISRGRREDARDSTREGKDEGARPVVKYPTSTAEREGAKEALRGATKRKDAAGQRSCTEENTGRQGRSKGRGESKRGGWWRTRGLYA